MPLQHTDFSSLFTAWQESWITQGLRSRHTDFQKPALVCISHTVQSSPFTCSLALFDDKDGVTPAVWDGSPSLKTLPLVRRLGYFTASSFPTSIHIQSNPHRNGCHGLIFFFQEIYLFPEHGILKLVHSEVNASVPGVWSTNFGHNDLCDVNTAIAIRAGGLKFADTHELSLWGIQ